MVNKYESIIIIFTPYGDSIDKAYTTQISKFGYRIENVLTRLRQHINDILATLLPCINRLLAKNIQRGIFAR